MTIYKKKKVKFVLSHFLKPICAWRSRCSPAHKKLVAIVDLYFDASSVRTAGTHSRVVQATVCLKRSGVRAGALWPLVQRPDIIFDYSAQGAVKA